MKFKPLNRPQNLGPKHSGLLVKYPKIVVTTYLDCLLWSNTPFRVTIGNLNKLLQYLRTIAEGVYPLS